MLFVYVGFFAILFSRLYWVLLLLLLLFLLFIISIFFDMDHWSRLIQINDWLIDLFIYLNPFVYKIWDLPCRFDSRFARPRCPSCLKLTFDGQSIDEPRDSRWRIAVGVTFEHHVVFLIDQLIRRRVVLTPDRPRYGTYTQISATFKPKMVGGRSPFSSPSLHFPYPFAPLSFPFPPSPALFRPPSPAPRNRIWCIFALKYDINFNDFPENHFTKVRAV